MKNITLVIFNRTGRDTLYESIISFQQAQMVLQLTPVSGKLRIGSKTYKISYPMFDLDNNFLVVTGKPI